MDSVRDRPSPPEHPPRVSVVIPTFRDWGRLATCLEALDAQTYPSHLVEVLVVNNDPADPAPSSLPYGGELHILSEATPGSYAARNAGIEAASGPIIAFTDSDCIPDPRWIETGVRALQSGADRVAGHVELFYGQEPPTLADVYEELVGFGQVTFAENGTAVTANLITWRRCFDAVGPFNGALFSGGDMEWGFRAQRHGLGIRYVTDCIVRHPTRGSFDALFQRARRISGAAPALRELRGRRRGSIRAVFPPRSVLTIARAEELSPVVRVRLMGIAYAIKLWQVWSVLLLRAGLLSPARH